VITHVSEQYATVTAFVNPADLPAITALESIENVQEELTPITGGHVSTPPTVHANAPTACPGGDEISEGDVQLNAILARSTYTLTGSGVDVGILSDSYNRDSSIKTAAQDISSGDLPGASNPCGFTTAITVLAEGSPGDSDEGRGMLQIIHDLAPGSRLGFATAFSGLFEFADNIRALRTWGAEIIADDVFYFVEPVYQEGPVSVAISDVVSSGVMYFTSAGNSNEILSSNNVASNEAPAYRPASRPSYLPSFETSCHDFNPSGAVTDNTYSLTLNSPGAAGILLQWAQPWYGVTTDLDILVTNISNSPVAGSLDTNTGPSGSQVPFEYAEWTNLTGSTQTYFVHICRYTSGGADMGTPRTKMVMLTAIGLTAVEYPTSSGGDVVGPTIIGHSASLHSLSVAAAPYNDNNNPETYSSHGPATHYFGPVLGTTPAAPITPQSIQQPDFTATDGGCTTFFGSFSSGCYRFYGTSAAAPHAAAVAALMKQKANQVGLPLHQSSVKGFLQSTARSMSGGNVNSVGAGLIDALAATNIVAGFSDKVYLPIVIK
jgi:hypothetical protein